MVHQKDKFRGLREANCVKPIVQERGHLYKSEAKSVGERSIYMYIEKRDASCIRKSLVFIGMRLLKGQRDQLYRT